jgi:hypothetical protein
MMPLLPVAPESCRVTPGQASHFPAMWPVHDAIGILPNIASALPEPLYFFTSMPALNHSPPSLCLLCRHDCSDSTERVATDCSPAFHRCLESLCVSLFHRLQTTCGCAVPRARATLDQWCSQAQKTGRYVIGRLVSLYHYLLGCTDV